MKIYTRTGDGGETGLFDGTRVSKSDARVAAYGDVDELGAWIGLARASGLPDDLATMLERIQRDLFALGARLADPAHRIAERVTRATVSGEDIARLEGWIDTLEAELPPLRRFILAGGSRGGASLHVARAICRRAERAIAALGIRPGSDQGQTGVRPGSDQGPTGVRPGSDHAGGALDPELLVYVNRLSDLLFVMARTANARAGVPEAEW